VPVPAADPYELAEQAAARIAQLSGVAAHDALVVLGSGWGPAADAFGEPVAALPMSAVPGFRTPSAQGHRGEIRSYRTAGVATLVLLGRTHLYEGHGLDPVVHGVRAAAAAGVRLVVLTNANGSLHEAGPDTGVGEGWQPGRAVLVADHLTMAAASPLRGPRFTDLTDAWSPRLRSLARQLDPTLAEGTYAWLPGPHYETRAEAAWLRCVGADMVGMSTVPEAIAARERGLEVLGLSTVTAVEGPAGSSSGIDPAEVVAVAERTAVRLGPLLRDLVVAALTR
jgi:purine-nucleoside phosphorylase